MASMTEKDILACNTFFFNTQDLLLSRSDDRKFTLCFTVILRIS